MTVDQHVPDHELLGLADGELTPQETAPVEAHLATCEACSTRRTQLVQQMNRLTQMLAATDWVAPPRAAPVVPQRVLRTGWWRAAAVLAVLLAGGVAVQPLRALMMKGARAGWEGIVTLFRAEPPSPAAPVPSASFPAGGRLTVRLDSQSSGSLTVEVTDEPLATVYNVGTGTQLVVLPDELRLLGAVPPDQPILLRVPVTVRELEIREGPRVQLLRPSGVGGRWVLEFAPPR